MGRILYSAVVGGFGSLFTLVLLSSLGVDLMWLVAITVFAAAGVLVWLVHRLSALRTLPTYHDYPRNYFTLFAGRHPTNRYEIVTDMWPPEVAAGALGARVTFRIGVSPWHDRASDERW